MRPEPQQGPTAHAPLVPDKFWSPFNFPQRHRHAIALRMAVRSHAVAPVLATVCVLLGIHGPATVASARNPSATLRPIEQKARQLVGELRRRGEPVAEIHLALAALFGHAGDKRAFKQLEAARKLGINPVRLALVHAPTLLRVGRHDEAMATLVQVLVHYPEQSRALVTLWKTLYEAMLQGKPLRTDVDAIRKRLGDFGLHFPEKLELGRKSESKSSELTALGYNALLAKRSKYAAELFEAAIDFYPSNARAHRGLGMARAQLFDHRRATGAFLLYLELNPAAPDAEEIDRRLASYWKGRSN
jgi:tetratricopeptide (TPR) repeat protein